MYKNDEISAKRSTTAPSFDYRVQAVVKFIGACMYGAGPPEDWRRAHDQALKATALARQADTATILRNRPVPRTASGHYIPVDNGPSTIYFY